MERKDRCSLILLLDMEEYESVDTSILESKVKSLGLGLEAMNKLIAGGGHHILLKREDTDWIRSLLSLSRIENLDGPPPMQTHREKIYFNLNLKGDYINLFSGLNLKLLSNSEENRVLGEKYKIPFKFLDLGGSQSLTQKNELILSQLAELGEVPLRNPLNMDDGWEPIDADATFLHLKAPQGQLPEYYYFMENIISKYSNLNYRIYLGHMNFSLLKHQELLFAEKAADEFLREIIPPPTFMYYQGQKIENVGVEEGIVISELDPGASRIDKIQNLGHLYTLKYVPASRASLAEDFMKTIAYKMGSYPKFGS